MILNSKSILDCNESESKTHYNEIEQIDNFINELPDYNCIAVLEFKDEISGCKNSQRVSCNLHDFLELVENVDATQGIDLIVGDNNLLTIVAYGEDYLLKSTHYTPVANIIIMPINDSGEFIDIGYILVRNFKSRKINLGLDN